MPNQILKLKVKISPKLECSALVDIPRHSIICEYYEWSTLRCLLMLGWIKLEIILGLVNIVTANHFHPSLMFVG